MMHIIYIYIIIIIIFTSFISLYNKIYSFGITNHSAHNTDKQPRFFSCFSTRKKPRMCERGARDIGSSGNQILESFQCSTGEVATILISM